MIPVWPNHDEAWRQWRDALASGRMHHGWLLSGKPGVGKRDFAMAAARELVTEPGIPQPAGDHPDIIVLTYGPKDDKAEKAQAEGKPFDLARSIRIKQIRALQKRLVTRPTLGTRRAVIIDPADDLEKSAANALLKSLEEPPAGTTFILVSHSPSRLLPTIRSRCRTLRFPALCEAELQAMLSKAGKQADPAALAAAEGSFGMAMRFIEQDLAAVGRTISAIISGAEKGASLRGELARLIGARADRQRMQAVLDLAKALVVRAARDTDDAGHRERLIECHSGLTKLGTEIPTANFDPGLLLFGIGGLLVAAAPASEPAHG